MYVLMAHEEGRIGRWPSQAMNGIILLDSTTGRLLSSKQYTANFGIRGAASSEGGASLDPLYLSGLLFALYSNARATVARAAGETESVRTSEQLQT